MSIRRVGGGLPAQFAALEQIRSANNRPVDSVRRHLPGQAGEEQRELQEMGLLGNGLNLRQREKRQDPRQQAAQLRARLHADAYEETKAPLVDLQGDGAQFDEDSDRTPPTGTRLADLMPGSIAHLDTDFRAHEEDLVDEDEAPQGYSQQGSQSEEDGGFLAQMDDVGPELDEEQPLPFEPAGDFFAQLEDVPEEPRESLMRAAPPPVEASELPFDSGEPVEALDEEDVVEEQPLEAGEAEVAEAVEEEDVVEEQLAASALPWQERAEGSPAPALALPLLMDAWPDPLAPGEPLPAEPVPAAAAPVAVAPAPAAIPVKPLPVSALPVGAMPVSALPVGAMPVRPTPAPSRPQPAAVEEPGARGEPLAELESAPLQPWPEPVGAAPSLVMPAPSSAPAATGMLADDWGAFIPLPEDVPAAAELAAEAPKPPVDS